MTCSTKPVSKKSLKSEWRWWRRCWYGRNGSTNEKHEFFIWVKIPFLRNAHKQMLFLLSQTQDLLANTRPLPLQSSCRMKCGWMSLNVWGGCEMVVYSSSRVPVVSPITHAVLLAAGRVIWIFYTQKGRKPISYFQLTDIVLLDHHHNFHQDTMVPCTEGMQLGWCAVYHPPVGQKHETRFPCVVHNRWVCSWNKYLGAEDTHIPNAEETDICT